MKCLIYIKNLNFVLIFLVYNVYAFPYVVQYPATCTYQRTQTACTFSLLCYLTGGISVEGCGENSTKVTCCLLKNSHSIQQLLTYVKSNKINFETTAQQNKLKLNLIRTTQIKTSSNKEKILPSVLYTKSSSSTLTPQTSTESTLINFSNSKNSVYQNTSPSNSFVSSLFSRSFHPKNPIFLNHKTHFYQNPSKNYISSQIHQQYYQPHQSHNNLYYLHNQKLQQNQENQYFLNFQHIHNTNINNAKTFHFPPYFTESNNPTIAHQYSFNYLLNDNYNNDPYNNFYPNIALNNFDKQNSNFYNIPELHLQPSINSAQSSLSKLNSQLISPFINDFAGNTGSVPLLTNLLSSYTPTQTFDYHTYQKHDTLLNKLNNINSSPTYSPSPYSTSSSLSYLNTNNNNSNVLNSSFMDKLKKNNLLLQPEQEILLNTETALYENESPKISSITTSSTEFDESNNNEKTLTNVFSSDKNLHLNSNNKVLEEEYNSNAIKRSRLSSSPLNSITMEHHSHSKNYIGEDICGKPLNKPMNRIIGGQDAYFGEFPWQVHIKIDKHQCGGALINKDFVITAAHCVYQAPLEQLAIIIGAHDIEEHQYQAEPPQYLEVESVLLHPHFRFSAAHPDRFDVALLKLRKPASYSGSVRPICLPPRQLKLEGWRAVVTGWGKTDTSLTNRYGTRLLQKVDVPIIKNNECEKWHQTRGIDLRIFSEMMCAGYEDGQKDACVGDSGGPLIILLNGRWTLAGITSAGFGCAQSRQPGIYHRVSFTVDWILEKISNLNK